MHFGGIIKTIKHWSKCNNCYMEFNIFLPKQQISQLRGKPFSGLHYLSGLTSNHHKPIYKSGFGAHALKHNLAFIVPDTSPRNINIKQFYQNSNFGDAASYNVDATKQPYNKYVNMRTYVTKQLPDLVSKYFPVSHDNISLMGYSMGGHGSLICGLKSDIYKSISAFSPIGNPLNKKVIWRQHMLKYFNDEKQALIFDTVQILKSGKYSLKPLRIDYGSHDQYQVTDELKVFDLIKTLKEVDYPHEFKLRNFYNHTYYFVQTFLEQHFDFHAKCLNKQQQ